MSYEIDQMYKTDHRANEDFMRRGHLAPVQHDISSNAVCSSLISFCRFVSLTHINIDLSIQLPSSISEPYYLLTTSFGNCRIKLTVSRLLQLLLWPSAC